jgi:hypothetical protein
VHFCARFFAVFRVFGLETRFFSIFPDFIFFYSAPFDKLRAGKAPRGCLQAGKYFLAMTTFLPSNRNFQTSDASYIIASYLCFLAPAKKNMRLYN